MSGTPDRAGPWADRTVTIETAWASPVTISLRVPADLAPIDADDLSGPLCLALLVALRAGEDLEIAGRVDRGLHARLDRVVSLYQAMDPALRAPRVHVGGLLGGARPRSPFTGVYLSRGVDSLYAAASAPAAGDRLDCAVFVDGLEPGERAEMRRAEVALVREAAAMLGLPLAVLEAPLRDWTDGIFDWEDAVGAGLAWVAHELSGGLGRIVIPSSDSVNTLGACGTGPALDPLFSSHAMTIEHGDAARSRLAKVSWLARHRPELLQVLRVCPAGERTDNCGRCGKCLLTLVCLRAAGGFEGAPAFAAELDLDELATLPIPGLRTRYEFEEARAVAASNGDRALARSLEAALRTASARRLVASQRTMDSFRAAHSNLYLTLLETGTANRSAGVVRDARALARLRVLVRRRSGLARGRRPPESRDTALGVLATPEMGATVPVWVVGGRVVTDRDAAGAGRWRPRGWRYATVPLGSGAVGGLGLIRRALEGARRTLVGARRAGGGARRAGRGVAPPPAGHLYRAPGPGRLPLWAVAEPATGQQYLATSVDELARDGSDEPALLGYIEVRLLPAGPGGRPRRSLRDREHRSGHDGRAMPRRGGGVEHAGQARDERPR